MGWETRKGKRYYYRKERRDGGRVVSVYCGGGECGEAAEREDRARMAGESAARPPDELAQVSAKKGNETAPALAVVPVPAGDPVRVWLEQVNDSEQLIRD